MKDDLDYFGVCRSSDGEVSLSFYYMSGAVRHFILDDNDIISLIAALLAARNEEMDEWQTYH